MLFTAAELISRVREYADARDDGDSPYISDAAICTWLTQEHRRMARRCARLRFPLSEAVGAGSDVAEGGTLVTADLLAIIEVMRIDGSLLSGSARLERVPRRIEGTAWATGGNWWFPTYAGSAANVQFGKAGRYSIRTVNIPAALTPAGSISLPGGWEEVLVLGAALRAKAKEGSDTESPLLRQLYQDEWEDVEIEAANFANEPVVKNVDRTYPLGFSSVNGSDDPWDWWFPS